MRRFFVFALVIGFAVACTDVTGPVGPDLSAESADGVLSGAGKRATPTRPFKMSNHALELKWGIERDQELQCEGDEIAGGEIIGRGNFTHLGRSSISLSAAWDIGARIADPSQAQYSPTGPAGGPFAPVLQWPDDYPYNFQFDPFTQTCGQVVSATGELVLTAANGHQVHGVVVGGETHRLDFVLEGDGIETFAEIEVVGGTGRFANATGAFVVHTITRFDFATSQFVIDLAEVLAGGTIAY
jgi:hypothetical protein